MRPTTPETSPKTDPSFPNAGRTEIPSSDARKTADPCGAVISRPIRILRKVILVLVLAYFLLPDSLPIGPGRVAYVTFFPWRLHPIAAFIGVVFLYRTRRITPGKPKSSPVILTFGLMLVMTLHTCTTQILWSYTSGRTLTVGGEKYGVLGSGGFGRGNYALARREVSFLGFQRWQALAWVSKDAPRQFLPLISPLNNNWESVGALYATPDGWLLLGLPDLRIACHPASQRLYANETIVDVSPFQWVPPEGQLRDMEHLRKEVIRMTDPSYWMRPIPREHFESGLEHPHPEIRKISKEILEAWPSVLEEPNRER